MKVGEILEVVEKIAPAYLAMPLDNVGLQVGDLSAQVEVLLLALEVSDSVLAEAKSSGVQLLLTHHPLIYRPMGRIETSAYAGSLVAKALRLGLSVISAHTNLDCARYGISETLAQVLGIEETRPLVPSPEHRQYKLVTFVPEGDLEEVRQAMGAAGAGRIGDYRFCTFRTPGTGSFMGKAGTHPAVGEPGRLEEVKEYRLETIAGRDVLDAVVAALKGAHSYEEVPFDVYPLEGGPAELGLGRAGNLAEPVAVREFLENAKTVLNSPVILFSGEAEREIRRVAVCGGSGGAALAAAIDSGADLYLAGELNYHDVLRAQGEGLCVAAAGHFSTERPGLAVFEEMLAEQLQGVNIILSETGGEPFMAL